MNREYLKKLVLEELNNLKKIKDEEEGCLEEMGCSDSQDTINHSHEQEGKMHRSSLFKMAKYSVDLLDIIQDEDDLPEWVESKITKAADYLGVVKHYLEADDAREMGALEESRSERKRQDIEEINQIMMTRMQPTEVQGLLMILQRDYGHTTPLDQARPLEEGSRSYSSKTTGNYVMPDKGVQLSRSGVRNLAGDKVGGVTDISDMGADHNRMVKKAKSQEELAKKFLAKDPGGKSVRARKMLINKFKKMGLKKFPNFDVRENVYEDTIEEYLHIEDATYDDGTPVEEDVDFWDDVVMEAEYQGRKVTLNKPMKGDVKKSKVYVKNEKGNVIKVNFGDPNMKIKKSNPKRRKSFRARHNCKNPGPKTKARYWSCRAW